MGGLGGGGGGNDGEGGGVPGGGGIMGGFRQTASEKFPVPARMISSLSALLRVQLSVAGAESEMTKFRQFSARQKATSTKSPPREAFVATTYEPA